MNAFPKSYFILLALAVALAAGVACRQFIVERNFLIEGRVPCDPAKNSCFVSDCDPSEDLSCLTTPYLKADELASIAPLCLEQGVCAQFACPEGADAATCQILPCTPDNLDDGEHCTPEPNAAP